MEIARIWWRKWRWYERNSPAVEPDRHSSRDGAAGAHSRAGRSTETSSRHSATAGSMWASTTLFEPDVWLTISDEGRIRIGAGTFLNIAVMVAAQNLVEIGDHCMFANGCFVTDANHRFDDPTSRSPGRASPARARPASATTSGAAPTW
jgi:acetyltransferase-like isoleucine patch superfamily enzyme